MKKKNDNPFVMIEWNSENISREFAPEVQEVPKAIRQMGIQYLLLNFQNLDRYLSIEEQTNAVEHWLPQIKEANLKRLAVLVPKK